jgi:hypothetical protein
MRVDRYTGTRTNATLTQFEKPLFPKPEMNSPSCAEQRTVDRNTHPRRKHNSRISAERHFYNDDAQVPFATAGFGRRRRALYRDLPKARLKPQDRSLETCRLRLVTASGISTPTGAVAEWLKAAVC